MNIQKVAVAGGGRMGRQIAMCCAIHGCDTSVFDVNEAVLADVNAWAAEYLQGRIEKKRMTEEQAAAAKSRFHITPDMASAAGEADMVIEAIFEDRDIKKEMFRKLSGVVKDGCIFTTNSSFMVSSTFADSVKDPSRLCNMHFYNPALVMEFVEVVQGPHTDPAVAQAVYEFCRDVLKKKPVLQKKEIPGFAGNYLLRGLNRCAQTLEDQKILRYQESDILIEQGIGRKKGPFHLMDMTGLNLTWQVLSNEFNATGVKPPIYDLVDRLVSAGRIGRQTGHGFYDYEEPYTLNDDYIPHWDELGVAVRPVETLAVVGTQAEALRFADEAGTAGVRVILSDGEILPAELSGADLILEALPDDENVKKAALARLSALAPECVIVSASERIPSSALKEAVQGPARLLTVHFLPGIQPLEVVQGPHTAQEAVAAFYELARKLGRVPLWERAELPGFGYMNYINSYGKNARYLVENGYCTVEEADVALVYGLGHTEGFFETVDRIGVDVFFKDLQREYRESGEKPAMYDTFAAMVERGELGVKTGKGFRCGK